jgi:tetratricopeptide (TPR) repeat protein
MTESLGTALRTACLVLALGALAGNAPAAAQQTADDAAGREYFERGREAFERADYESALVYFRHAYRLSRRGELQYNIGVAADRLQREEEALEAFQHYLEETEEPTRQAEVRERIDALQRSIAERKATELALDEATIRYRTPEDGARVPKSAIIGASVLAAAGVAGVAAMSVGLAKNGTCKREVAGQCVVESSATSWTWVYGGLGVAALAGSATWFAISAKRAKTERETQLSFGPAGLRVSGKF